MVFYESIFIADFAVWRRTHRGGAEDAKIGWQAIKRDFSDKIYRIDGINFIL